MNRYWQLLAILALAVGISVWEPTERLNPAENETSTSCEIALVPAEGDSAIDADIRATQQRAEAGSGREHQLERLAWLYIEKARATHDDGYFNVALEAANCLLENAPNSSAAKLLKGHIMHSLHRFEEAEQIAVELVAARGNPFDYGLLGDALMDRGRLTEAEPAYQRMIDLKPGLQSYSRGAHLMWLRGDAKGAAAVMRAAASAGGPRVAEPTAWAYTRLAMYLLQESHFDQALEALDAAVSFSPDYAPALLARGRVLLASQQNAKAHEDVARASEQIDLPEYRWLLADTLRLQGRAAEAGEVESELEANGEALDPRTYSVYLATRGIQPKRALSLAETELENRQDVFTYDALAWSRYAAGDLTGAWAAIQTALSEGTQDARLFLHAGVIADSIGEADAARHWLARAEKLRHMLFPSEAALLDQDASDHPPGHLTS